MVDQEARENEDIYALYNSQQYKNFHKIMSH